VESEEGGERVTESASQNTSGGPLHTLLRRVVDVKEEEVNAMLTSFAFFFFLLSGYFVLRPIRDAVAAASGVTKLTWLFSATLAATLICNPLFSALVVRFPIRRVIPISYNFFVATFLTFYAVLRFVSSGEGSTVDIWMGRAFFVWVTVFALFNTSIFWSLMADVWRSEQAKRVFGFIAVGGTFGSIVGSATTAALARTFGAVNMLLVSAVLVELGVITIVLFPLHGHGTADRATRGRQAPRGDGKGGDVIGGSVWAGFTGVLKSPYLLAICVFMILYTLGSTVLYFAQSDIVGRVYADRTARTAVLAQIELVAQVLTVLTQIFFTGRIIRWIGLAAALALLPLLSVLGFAALGAVPVFATLAIFIVVRRASNFALTNPSMEVLFTVVKREDKYKAKNIIETFVYRGGDQLAAWYYAGLAALGLGLAGISFVTVPLSMIWLGIGLWLGRRQAKMAATSGPQQYSISDPKTGPSPVEPSTQPL
jgi:AAA family ATP:ADP antiporter